MTLRFHDEAMHIVASRLQDALAELSVGGIVAFEVPDPDYFSGLFSGELTELGGRAVRYRDHLCWVDLAEALACRFRTPERLADGFVRLSFQALDVSDAWHDTSLPSGHSEKYGSETTFARINKFECPSFATSYGDALGFLRLPETPRVLALGVNQGAELGRIPGSVDGVGIDHSASAIASAVEAHPKFRFLCADLQELATLDLGRFDLVVAINTLQSAKLDGRALFRTIVKDCLRPSGAVLVGLPNSRYEDQTLRFGTRAKHHRVPEWSVLLKDAMFYRRYLAQQGFEVAVTGKYTTLVAGRRL